MKGLPVEPRITQYLYQKAAAAGVPLSGTFELTPLCNMACKMCYVRLEQSRQAQIGPLQPAEKWLELAQKAKDAGMLYLLITGGEPFSYPDIRAVLEGLHAMGLLVSINSNGTLINENTVAWLKNCPPVRINISLYGATDDTYCRLCGDSRGFTKVCRAVRLLQEAGIPVKLSCSLTPDNAKDLPQMVALAKQWKVPIQVATYMFPPLRRDENAVGRNFRFSPEEAAYYMAYTDYLIYGKEAFLARGCDTRLPPEADDPCGDLGDGVRCRAGKCSFWVTWQGQMLPCGMFPPEKAPNVFKEAFLPCWQAVKDRTGQIRLPATCAGCQIKDSCHACAAMVVTESGSFDKLPQYRCQMMAAYPQQWKKVSNLD